MATQSAQARRNTSGRPSDRSGAGRSAKRTVLAVAILASFVAFLDGSVVNVALPAIDRELGGGLAGQQWVVDAYLLSLSSVILLAGSLSDLFGRKRVLLWGLVGFGVASVACAERLLLALDLLPLRKRQAGATGREVSRAHRALGEIDHRKLLRANHRQGLQPHRVDELKDGGVGADTERQRQHRHGGECRVGAELSRSETKVLQRAVKPGHILNTSPALKG